jgi:Alw26I/Eco31I/Esp3I family type II restriction m6 adenine DNA methyltransferase
MLPTSSTNNINDATHHNQLELDAASIEKRVQELRNEFARGLQYSFSSQTFNRQLGVERVAQSAFSSFAANFAHPDPIRILAFNLAVTESVVSRLIDTESAPESLVFLASRAAEAGMNQILDPDQEGRRIKFLGASKKSGYFFTPPKVAMKMAEFLLKEDAHISRLLDPSAGTGALLGAAVIVASRSGIKVDEVIGIELDPFTASLLQRILERIRAILDTNWKILIVSGDAVSLLSDSKKIADYQADRIIMNPPYGRVKFLVNSLTNDETRVSNAVRSFDEQADGLRAEQKARAKQLRQLAREIGLDQGSQDLQRTFIGLALRCIVNGGRLVLISSSSWLADRDSRMLRSKLISERRLSEIVLYDEDAGLFATVNQPTAITVIGSEGAGSNDVKIVVPSRDLGTEVRYDIKLDDVVRRDPTNQRIPRLDNNQLRSLDILLAQPRIRDINIIQNLRGELDQSLDSNLFSNFKTTTRLVRGDHIERYIVRPPEYSKLPSFVDPAKMALQTRRSAKFADAAHPRIVGRQCSYMNKSRRLSFALQSEPAYLGNSCNYLTLRGGCEPELTLKALVVFLNSAAIEWFFRVFNSNNHVANYEIDEFPIRIDNPEVIACLARCHDLLANNYHASLEGGKNPGAIEDFADALVCFAFQLSPIDAAPIMHATAGDRAERVLSILDWLHGNRFDAQLLRGTGAQLHVPPTLSGLDREIISFVPQGGNWQDIPDTVPSKRLAQIREMTRERGVVRTTYYGRLRPDQPSYTISTYYNRPGNGTNIHHWEDRTLSSREAARLQSFPDWYFFAGSDAAVRTQIGNAVPPLLAASVGQAIRDAAVSNTAVDLFAGAGGLSLGLEGAGWNVIAAVDHNRDALLTYQLNHACEIKGFDNRERSLCLQADLADATVKAATIRRILEKLDGRPLGLLAGGPPCQGFSHAGWRSEGDQRNDLAISYLDFVEGLSPEMVLLENVEGLLTFGGGRVLNDILGSLSELGYSTTGSPWRLAAEEFGVPQMRRRVFVIGSRFGAPPSAPAPLFKRCAGRRSKIYSPSIFDYASPLPDPISAAEALHYLPPLTNGGWVETESTQIRTGYADLMSGQISRLDFLARCS